jgi:HlyD family secretion protein
MIFFGMTFRTHIVLILVAFSLLAGCRQEEGEWLTLERNAFEVRLFEAGSISALHSTTVSVPRVRMNLQILYLADEGTLVKAGDTLVVFDQAEVQKRIEDRESALELAEASLRKGTTRLKTELAQRRSTLVFDSTSWELSRLREERTRYESEIARQEAQIFFYQSTLSLEKSRAALVAQLEIQKEEFNELQLKVAQAKADLKKAWKDHDNMVVKAPGRGMVVFLPIWKGSTMGKVKVGDTPWRGSSIMELPDFDTMQVDLKIDEVDFNLVHLRDSCDVVLDAWPDKHFSGRIVDMGLLARDREDDSGLKAFDVQLLLDESSEILKPGMNAQCTIFGYREEDALSLPLEALKRKNEGWFVYRNRSGETAWVEVTIGPSNGDHVLIHEGLEPGDRVQLDWPRDH